MSDITNPDLNVETPETPEIPAKDPKPESPEEGYYKRQFEKLSKKLETFEKAEDERKKTEMSEIERLKAENTEVQSKANQVLKDASLKVLKADARAQAAAAGVKADRLERFVKILDLDAVTMDPDDYSYDPKAVARAVKATLEEMPEFLGKSTPPDIGAGTKGASEPLSESAIAKMSNEELKRRMPDIQAYYAARR